LDSFGKSRDIKIKIKKPPLRDNGSIIYNKGKVTHAITIPNSFMQRMGFGVGIAYSSLLLF
jgi:hypothetical protein